MEEVGAEEGLVRFLEENAGVPAVRHVGRGDESELVPAGGKHIVAGEDAGRANGEVIHADHGSYESADGLGRWGDLEPLVEAAALVGLEVAEADVAELGWVDQARDLFTQQREHTPQSGVKEERFVVADQKVAELEIDLRHKDRDPVDLRRNLRCGNHGSPPSLLTTKYMRSEEGWPVLVMGVGRGGCYFYSHAEQSGLP